jgi:hypothetical protein
VKAIETTYRGTVFRSRLEAQWAEFFDLLAVAWDYEPEGYTNGHVRYLPDFWLPRVHHRGGAAGLFFEVKPSSPLAGEVDKAVMLACGSGKPVIVVAQSPRSSSDWELLNEYVRQGERSWEDEGLQFARCDHCGALDIGFYSSDEPLCSCGLERFTPYSSALCSARNQFTRLSRWKRAA